MADEAEDREAAENWALVNTPLGEPWSGPGAICGGDVLLQARRDDRRGARGLPHLLQARCGGPAADHPRSRRRHGLAEADGVESRTGYCFEAAVASRHVVQIRRLLYSVRANHHDIGSRRLHGQDVARGRKGLSPASARRERVAAVMARAEQSGLLGNKTGRIASSCERPSHPPGESSNGIGVGQRARRVRAGKHRTGRRLRRGFPRSEGHRRSSIWRSAIEVSGFDFDAALRWARFDPKRTLARPSEAALPMLGDKVIAGSGLLLDTCVYIDQLQGRAPDLLDELLSTRQVNHSTIAIQELMHSVGVLNPRHSRDDVGHPPDRQGHQGDARPPTFSWQTPTRWEGLRCWPAFSAASRAMPATHEATRVA